jgi:hypothetical protein
MAYIFCSALSVLAFVPAMYETILFVGFMMLQNIPVDDEYLEWDDAPYTEKLWDVTIGTKDGMFFHLYQDNDPAFDNLFVGELCETHKRKLHILDRQHFSSQKLCVNWFMDKASELESWDSTNPIS